MIMKKVKLRLIIGKLIMKKQKEIEIKINKWIFIEMKMKINNP